MSTDDAIRQVIDLARARGLDDLASEVARLRYEPDDEEIRAACERYVARRIAGRDERQERETIPAPGVGEQKVSQ